jgi:lipid-A-disaccharide synthase
MAVNDPIRIFFSAGEPSGDLHAANLIRQLTSACDRFEAVGYGGPKMQDAGCRLHTDLTTLAIMGFVRAAPILHKLWDLKVRANRYFRDHRPDAVVLIDFPGFNWWVARQAKQYGIPVFYYVPPQIWAWASWRVKKMRRLVDHVLCCLPFEETWFREHGCNATLVGHPFFDEVGDQQLDEGFMSRLRDAAGPLVVILPGSRTQEVEHNVDGLVRAAEKIRAEVSDARFAVAAFKPSQANFARKKVAQSGIPMEVHAGRTPELIRVADCCISVSGSVSLELLYHTKPTVIQYQIGRTAYALQRLLRNIKYITLVNLLAAGEVFPDDLTEYDPEQPDADRVPFPEYLTCEDKSSQIASHIIEWLTDPTARQARIDQLAGLKAEVADSGASRRATEYILAELTGETGRRAEAA